jgi:hypothetical protein
VYTTAELPQLAPVAGVALLLELAVGTLLVSYLLDLTGRVGRGFAGTTALICALVAGLVTLIAATLPSAAHLLNGAVSAGALDSFVHWCLVFCGMLLLFALFCAVGTDASRRIVGVATAIIGGVALGKLVAAFGPALGGSLAAAVAFVPATLLAGSALAGMLLGHWYLVAPSLSFRPLRLAIYAVLAAVAVQTLALAAVLATASPSARHQLLAASYALPFWLLVIGAGVVFTTAVTLLTLYFARIRANQPATAMLYALIVSVAMGVVPGHLLFFLTGTPV